MTEPSTVNTGLIIPNTGDLVGTWGSAALNPNLVVLDGYLGGVQTISLSNVPVTLTSPAGYTPTPGGGPTQSQNAIIIFTGTLTAGVTVTLPLPGFYIVNNLTTGAFVTTLKAAGSGNVIGVDQGETVHVFNDGTNVSFVNMGRIGKIEIWAGLSAIPSWVTACTVPPFLLCDGTVYNFTTYPALGARLGGNFGGNGITTFGVPDLRGRVALPYDGTGTRITATIGGLNGQQLGAAADNQGITLATTQIPSHNHTATDSGHTHTMPSNTIYLTGGSVVSGGTGTAINTAAGTLTAAGFANISVGNTGGGGSHANVQPSQVTGIAVIRAA